MATDNDLQQPEPENNDNSSSPSPSPAGQSGTDWEARFKGLQTEFNKLQNSLRGKDSYLTQLQTQLKDAQAQVTSLTADYEGQLTQLRADLGTRDTELTGLRDTKTKLETELSQTSRKMSIQGELAKPEYQGLLNWHNAGYLPIPDDMEVGSDAFKAHVGGFKAMLAGKSAEDFTKTMQSTTPPQFGTTVGGNAASGMTMDELSEWITKNPDHPDYARYHDQYLSLAEEQYNK